MATRAKIADLTIGTIQPWHSDQPTLRSEGLSLRALRDNDAQALAAMFAAPEVRQHMGPAPVTIEEFRRFISWAESERRERRHLALGLVPRGSTRPVGLFQIWSIEPGFRTAEWGFALAKPHWGRGFFAEGARLLVDFAVDSLGVRRLEARVAVENARGQAALRNLGAVREGVLRECFESGGEYRDQVMWSILAREWQGLRRKRFPALVSSQERPKPPAVFPQYAHGAVAL